MTSLLQPAPGVQHPRIEHRPEAAVDESRGWDAVDLADVAGLHLDPWQQHALVAASAVRADQKWAAFEVGLVVARQNGKGSVLEARELAGLFLWGERLIIHSAHEFKTAVEAFNRVRGLIENTPLLAGQVARVRTANGEEAIELTNGCRLRFMARSSGAGRGFSGDTVILDEAYRLPSKTIAAIMPTMAARSIDGNPQIWYTSSAGMTDSETLASIRERGIAGDDPRLCYLEHSAASWDDMTPAERAAWDGDRDRWRADPAVWAQANPALGVRISPEFVSSELDGPMSGPEFERERLGVWEKIGGTSLISAEDWQALADPTSAPANPLFLALDVPPDRASAVIAVAGAGPDGRTHVELVDRRDGTRWVTQRMADLVGRWHPAGVVVDGSSAAGVLLGDLARAGVRPMPFKRADYLAGCGQFYDAVIQGRIVHLGDPVLGGAVESAQMLPKGDSLWVWSRRAAAADISPLVAATLACWGLWSRQGKRKQRARLL